MTLFLAAHNDDETLFGAFSLLTAPRYIDIPHVVVVYRSYKQAADGGPEWLVRETETNAAMEVLNCTWEQWEYADTVAVDEAWLVEALRGLAASRRQVLGDEFVYAPALLDGGHEHHNLVGRCAAASFPPRFIRWYATYRRGEGRHKTRHPVALPAERVEALLTRKRAALDCYASQIARPDTAPWFDGDQTEYLVQ